MDIEYLLIKTQKQKIINAKKSLIKPQIHFQHSFDILQVHELLK